MKNRNTNDYSWIWVVIIFGIILFLLFGVFLPRSNSTKNQTPETTYEDDSSREREHSEWIDDSNSTDIDFDDEYYTGGSRDSTDCNIKGNISYNTGEKIYHIPGDAYYNSTTINESYGERWFCSEQEAQSAGWRRAYE